MHQPSLLSVLSVMDLLANGTEYTSVWPISRSLPTLSSTTHLPASDWSTSLPSLPPCEMDAPQVVMVSTGVAVGLAFGVVVGVTVGVAVGVVVGVAVGAAVGVAVGAAVGVAVGAAVQHGVWTRQVA